MTRHRDERVTRRRFGEMLLAGAGLGALARAAAPAPPPTVVLRDLAVRVRDGIHLATDVYLPAAAHGGGMRVPAILERTPYDKSADSRSERTPADPKPKSRAEVAEFFVRRGYAVVYQDCRGRYRSEGTFVKYLSDGYDGYDTCAWILAQPWSDGRIGTMGLSYAAHTQGALGSANAPGVKAMFLDSGGFANAYQGGIRQGGAFELKQATWAYGEALQSPAVRADPARRAILESVDLKRWFHRFPWHRGDSPLSAAPDYESYLFDQWEHGNFDAYWKQLGLYAEGFYDAYCDAAMVHMSSWFDPYPRTATQNYMGLSRRKRGPVRLILGPWTHGDRQLTYAGDVDFGAAATVDGNLAADFLTLRARWFDRWLKGTDNGVDAEPAVRLFIMGGGSGRKTAQGRLDHGGRWRAERDWPIPDAKWTRLHLHRDGVLAGRAPSEHRAFRQYRYDPRHPVPTLGGTVTSGKPIMVGGAFDQREAPAFYGSEPPYPALAARPDVLVFQTPPLEDDLEVTGPVSAVLWISSDCPDTDFTVKLIDVYPPNADYPAGYAMNLTDGILRVRYRDSWEQPRLMTPGEVYRIAIDAFPTGNLFKRGHRLRVDVSSSNFPHFDLNPNSGEAEGRMETIRVAQNRVYLDRARPSHVLLPVIPLRG
jgi:hypothetical protein